MDYNKDLFDGMILFCKVVEQDGLSAAARVTGHTPSHVSKEIQRLEARLGTRLLNRTTRKISLTESGRVYYDNARRIVDDARAVEGRLQTIGDRPYGVLRMSVPVVFAHGCLNAWLPEFLERYPDISLQMDVSERHADLVAEGIDLLVRIGELPSSDMIARELFRTAGIAVASPDYLERRGVPQHPSELAEHDLIDFSFHRIAQTWSFSKPDGKALAVPVTPRIRCNDAATEMTLACAGRGITRLPELACERELRSGELVRVLRDFERAASGVHVIYASRENLPSKTRAMIDFLIEKSG